MTLRDVARKLVFISTAPAEELTGYLDALHQQDRQPLEGAMVVITSRQKVVSK